MLSNLTNHFNKLSDGNLQCEWNSDFLQKITDIRFISTVWKISTNYLLIVSLFFERLKAQVHDLILTASFWSLHMIMYLKEIKSTHKIPFIPLEHSKYKTEMIWSQLHLFDYYIWWLTLRRLNQLTISLLYLLNIPNIKQKITLKMWLLHLVISSKKI